jgi:hypothetical protein
MVLARAGFDAASEESEGVLTVAENDGHRTVRRMG